MTIGIVILATNGYLPLGIRFIKKFLYHYHDTPEIKFYFFSNEDPSVYLSEKENSFVKHIFQNHSSWRIGTNSKYLNIVSLKNEEIDYLFYFDADTNITKSFSSDWFLGDMVAGEHFNNRIYTTKPYDRNPVSKAYVSIDSTLPQTYYYGAFYGGKKNLMIQFCETMRQWQNEDRKISYEPIWNDESYLNAYFHFNPPSKVIQIENFPFQMSDKGGIGKTRNVNLDITNLKEKMILAKNNLYNIANGILVIH